MTDKGKHLILGLLISFMLININTHWGFGISLLGFASKEIIWDKWMKKGTPEIWDFMYAFLPALLIWLTKMNA